MKLHFHQLKISIIFITVFFSEIGWCSYSEVEEAATKGIISHLIQKIDKDPPSNDPFIKKSFHKIFTWMKKGKINPDIKVDGIPIFYFFLQYDHYDALAKKYHQLFEEKIPQGNFDGNIFHYLVSFNPKVTDKAFRIELLQSYANDSQWDHCALDKQGLTPALYALKLKDYEYLKQLSELGMLCREIKDRKGMTIINHLKASNSELLRSLFPDIWLPQMQKRYKKFSTSITKKNLAAPSKSTGKKRKLDELNFSLPQAHEAMAHCTKRPKPGELCNICQDELSENKEQVLSRLCSEQCEKMVCFECADTWKFQCLNGQNLSCVCNQEGEEKRFLPNSAIAAFGANNCEIFDFYIRKLRRKLGEIDGFTPCQTPDCNGGTIVGEEEKIWHQCEICSKESYLLGKKVALNSEEIPKPWEKPRPCPHCYKAYYEITEACDHITCQNCNEEFNVVLGKSKSATYHYNDDDPYKRIRRYRIPGDLNKDAEPYTEYQEDVEPEDDIDLEELGVEVTEFENEDD